MKYLIQCSRVKATCKGPDGLLHTKFIAADEMISFDHDPSDDEIQDALNYHLFRKYPDCMFQYEDVFIKKLVK